MAVGAPHRQNCLMSPGRSSCGRRRRVHREEAGATAVEYALMIALISVVIMMAVTTLGGTSTTRSGESAMPS